jgi:ABC-2 type transport system ATP-binding protein
MKQRDFQYHDPFAGSKEAVAYKTMIHISGLHKSYGDVQALRDVSLDIAQGEIVGLLGPNGAGKTTMMKILTGYLQPDEGKVLVDNLDVLDQTAAVQSRIGYLPENAPLYPELTVQAYLQMMADLRQIPPAEQPTRLAEAVRAVALGPYLRRPISQLSKGYRQRVGLAQAIIHRPQLLDPRRADRRPRPDANRGDPRADSQTGGTQHHSLLHAHSCRR